LRRNPDQRPGAFIRQILDEVQRFGRHDQHDDITVLIAKCGNGLAKAVALQRVQHRRSSSRQMALVQVIGS
jgi:hypothetical protein